MLSDILTSDAIDRLKARVRAGGAVDISQVKIVGLDDIRSVAGDAWPQIAARVRTKSTYFLERRLGPDDVVIPAGDGLVVIYGAESGGDPDAKAAALQEALNAFFLGEEGMAMLRALVRSRTISTGALAAMLQSTEAEPRSPAEPAGAPPSELAFMPVWSVAQDAVTGYWPLPVHRAHGQARYGYASAWSETGAHGDEVDFLALDLQILARAVAGIEQSLAADRRCLVGYSVHVTTLQHRERRQAFLQRLKAAPEAVRPYLLGRVAELEPGTPAVTMAEWVHQLRPISPRVALELHHTERALGGLDGVGAVTVSCSLPLKPPPGDERLYYSQFIHKWSTALKRQGLRFRLDNIADPQLMALVLDGGVDFCSSEHFWPATAAPEGMKPYTQARLRQELGMAP